MIGVVSVVVVGVVGGRMVGVGVVVDVGVVVGVGVVIVAECRRKTLGGGESIGNLFLTVAGTLPFAIVVSCTCNTTEINISNDDNYSKVYTNNNENNNRIV